MAKMVAIKLDKVRHLKYGAMAFVSIERASGKAMGDMDFSQMDSVFTMLYGGLVWEDRKLTVDKVIEIVDELIDLEMEADSEIDFQQAMSKVMQTVSEKVSEAMGSKPEAEALPSK